MANMTMFRAVFEEMRARPQIVHGPPPPPHPPQFEDGRGYYHDGVDRRHLVLDYEQEERERRLNAFRKHDPPSFEGSHDPIVAARWLQALDKIFRVMQCTDSQRLLFATYKLQGDAEEWWLNTSRAYELQGHVITWPFFEEFFLSRYYPMDVQERMQGEFERLRQGSMTVDAYLARFNELAKFAHFRMAMPSPVFLAAKFRRGLSVEIAERIAGAASRDLGTLVQQCRDIEDVCLNNKKKMVKEFGAKIASSSTPWKYNEHCDLNEGSKVMQVEQPSDSFKKGQDRGGASGSESSLLKCNTCGKIHKGMCWYEQDVCFKCGKPSHSTYECFTKAERAARVLAVSGSQAGGRVPTSHH